MENIFIHVDEHNINNALMHQKLFLRADTIIRYRATETQIGDEIQLTFDVWTSDGEHFTITDPEWVLEFVNKVVPYVDD